MGSMLLIHGLTGCHAAPYMIRLAKCFLDQGYRTYRMDMRGFGQARNWSSNLAHAGRSDDVIAALSAIHDQNPGQPISATGISLGAAQLLRGIARIDAGLDPQPTWRNSLRGIAAISPPIDLVRCSENMQRRTRKLYNRYFIRNLISRLPPGVIERPDFQQINAGPRCRTLWELDDQFTAPLSGFENAKQYYEQSSARTVIHHLQTPTLILAAADDPIVPIDCFEQIQSALSESTTLLTPSSGGHVGFVGPGRRCWIDDVVSAWFSAHAKQSPRIV
ncbi:putative hydrolase [Rubripirellula obstinata]|uniref:Putative hydrolase n=2 Tax=Rubripirellula obstinata TaxID=406547 RepID=A0A5B1CIT7_9BACT|nr:putative hydrolase [Rubripirellula obstinata]